MAAKRRSIDFFRILLIDFLIGKAGQAKAKDFLLKWWVRFDDVRWRNFGRKEGMFAGELIERWFGRKIWSIRRIVMGVSVVSIIDPGFTLALQRLAQDHSLMGWRREEKSCIRS